MLAVDRPWLDIAMRPEPGKPVAQLPDQFDVVVGGGSLFKADRPEAAHLSEVLQRRPRLDQGPAGSILECGHRLRLGPLNHFLHFF